MGKSTGRQKGNGVGTGAGAGFTDNGLYVDGTTWIAGLCYLSSTPNFDPDPDPRLATGSRFG